MRFSVLPIGSELEPPRLFFVIPEASLPSSVAGREVPMQDAQQLLMAVRLVLIPFR